jgi:hypothetical protein
MAMSRTVEKSPENEHIQGALENRHTLRCLFFVGSHSTLVASDSRHSTIDVSMGGMERYGLESGSRVETSWI